MQNKAKAEHKTAWEPRTSVANKVREKLLPTVISFRKARHFIFGMGNVISERQAMATTVMKGMRKPTDEE